MYVTFKMKRREVLNVARQTYKLDVPKDFQCKEHDVQGIIDKLEEQKTIDEQQKLIRQLANFINKDDLDEKSQFVCGLLTYLYMTTDSKFPIRKTVGRILMCVDENLLTFSVRNNISYIIKDNNLKVSYDKRNEVVLNLNGCFNNFPAGVKGITSELKSVLRFTIDFLVDLTVVLSIRKTVNYMDESDILVFIYNVTKFFVAILQCKGAPQLLRVDSEKLMIATYKIIMDDFISFDIKSNTSVILIYAMNNLPEEIVRTYRFRVPCLQLLIKEEGTIQQFDISTNETAKISVYSAMLTVIPGDILATETIDGVPIISYLYTNLIDMAKCSSGKPSQIVIVSKTLTLMSKMMEFMPESELESMFKLGIEYIWAHLDYHIDTVRHLTRNVFQNFIKLAVRFGNKGVSSLIKIILSYLTDLLVNRSTHFIAFNLLAEETGIWFVLQYFNNLPLILLMSLEDPSLAPTICNTYEDLMEQHLKEEDDHDIWMSTWVELLKPMLKRSEPPITAFYQRLLIRAFQINPIVVKSILYYQHLSSPNELGALLGCVRWARKNISKLMSVQQRTNGENCIDQSHLWRELLEYKTLELNMCHQTDEIRIHVLALIVECQKSTEIFSEWELEFLKKFFYYNVTSQIPNTIQQIKSLYKKALTRIKEGDFVIQRQINTINRMMHQKPEYAEQLKNLIEQEQCYCNFLESFIEDHLKLGLMPWANHYRRSLCLELLSAAQECVPRELWFKIWKKQDVMKLYDVLDDTYESNIILATSIINNLPRDDNEKLEDIKSKIASALEKATTLKVSGSLSAAYLLGIHLQSKQAPKAMLKMLENRPNNTKDVILIAVALLMQCIEKELKVAQNDLVAATKSAPFYGLIFCIRHILEKQELGNYPNWEFIVHKLIGLCVEISNVVSPIVNNSSPEGFVPTDSDMTDREETDETAIAQMVLVYAWRTVKEVSLLLGEIAAKAPYKDPCTGREVLKESLLEKMIEYFHTTFYETKHRGAYEQAYIGFCKLCNRLWTMPNETTKVWPINWLNDIFNMLAGREKIEKFRNLCSTRRSAGLPFMVQAIVTTEPMNRANETFNTCMNTLLELCENSTAESEKSLMHAMNILRALYRHAMLGELVSAYIDRGMKVAINGFSSSSWGVRNSATLLFSALMTRIFGVQRNKDDDELSLKNRMTARVFFMRYPTLYDYLLQKLKEGVNSESDNLSVHPILIILGRLYPTNMEDEQQLVQFLPIVNACLKHSQYKTRELAAQASIPLIPRRSLLKYAAKLLLDLSDVTLTNNHCHGLIMQLIFLLRRIPNDTGSLDVPAYLEHTFWIFMTAGKFTSHSTAALYFDMIVLLTDTFSQDCVGNPLFVKLGEMLLWQAIYERIEEPTSATGDREFCKSRLLLLFQIVNRLCETSEYLKSMFLKEFLCLCIDSEDPEVTDFVLNLIHCLNTISPHYVNGALYVLEMIEFPESVKSVVHKMNYQTRVNTAKSLHGLIDNKIVNIFQFLLNRTKVSAVKLFIVLQHFPCLLPYIKMSIQSTLAYFLKWCFAGDDILVCASFGCISMILYHSIDCEIKLLDLSELLRAVIHYASPTATLHERLAVCQLMVHNKRLFCEKNDYVKVTDKIEFWNAVMILLEDNDQIIRDTISTLCTRNKNNSKIVGDEGLNLIASKAREELIEIMLSALPYRDGIRLLLKWALRKQYNPIPDDEGDETAASLADVVFDKGELNSYAEDECLSLAAINGLRKHLWTLDDGLSYADRSIFLEEHTFVVASYLYDSLNQDHEPLFSAEARITCTCILKRTLDYLEDQPIEQPNFMFLFENVLVKEIVNITFTKDRDPLKHSACDRFKFLFKRLFNIED